MSGLAERYKPCGATECEYEKVIMPLKAEIERLKLSLATNTDERIAGRRNMGNKILKLQSQLDKIRRIAGGDWGINPNTSMQEIFKLAGDEE